jgi:putative PIN family toxin of toxin-antitoxin system
MSSLAGVVLDVNVLISSVIAPLGIPRRLISAWQEGLYYLIISPGIIDELGKKLNLPRIANRYKPSRQLAIDTLALLRDQAIIEDVSIDEQIKVTGDPEDDYVLATARIAKAQYLVTGDAKLLEIKAYEGVKIVNPRTFIEILENEEGK